MRLRDFLVVLVIASLASPLYAKGGRAGGYGRIQSSVGKPSNGTYKPLSSKPDVRSRGTYGTIGGGRGGRPTVPHRSLLSPREPGRPAPSKRLSEIIRQRESSGPGWVGTAFLVYLFSRHDISDSDKRWLKAEIDRRHAAGEDDDVALLEPAHPGVMFNYTGLGMPIRRDMNLTIGVSAEADGEPVAVTCDIPGGRVVSGPQNLRASVFWTAPPAGVTILTCRAAERQDMRLLRVQD